MQQSTPSRTSPGNPLNEAAKRTVEVKENATLEPGGHGAQSSRSKYQEVVFTDPVALRYLEKDPSTVLLNDRLLLHGYETYIVEQWTCSRMHPTFLITTKTGDPSHTVVVGVLGIPMDETTWSPRLRLYFNAATQHYARMSETPLGKIILTDLENFPSSLTVIPVPDGDVNEHRDDFVVNENLKRLGCAGRAGLKLQYPPAATETKFHLLYRTSERVPLYSAVMGLIKLCKMALMMFDKLAPEYVDGLFCDVAEKAVRNWWMDIGIDLYNVEPSDGVLGPTTVAALLGSFLGARNRLHAYGVPVGKDAFDIPNLKRGVGAFQKSEKLRRTRRLDRTTLERLHRATAKALGSSSDRWTGAMKTTVAELSGKGGEMVMGMVGGRGKGGIADIETLDMDNFATLVTGAKAKWLWKGKPPKTSDDDPLSSAPAASDMMFTRDDQGGYVWTSRKKRSNEDLRADRLLQSPEYAPNQPDTARKGVSGRVSDARTGFGRFKGAMGLQGRRHKHSRESVDLTGGATAGQNVEGEKEKDEPGIENFSGRDFASGAQTRARNENEQSETPFRPQSPVGVPPEIHIETVPSENEEDVSDKEPVPPLPRPDDRGDESEVYRGSTDEAINDQEPIPEQAIICLRRSQSCLELSEPYRWKKRDDYFPRNLSFSTVEDVINGLHGFVHPLRERSDLEAVEEEQILASDARLFFQDIAKLNQNTVPWVERQVEAVEQMDRAFHHRDEILHAFLRERSKEHENIREASGDLLSEELSYLNGHARRVELLGAKLDYEIDTLESKVKDFESGIEEFEQHVNGLETRLKGLIEQDREEKSSSWLGWLEGLVTGVTGHVI